MASRGSEGMRTGIGVGGVPGPAYDCDTTKTRKGRHRPYEGGADGAICRQGSTDPAI
jgi:hypothetical protein